MKAPRIYEGFAFPLKNNVSGNRGYDVQPRERTYVLFHCRADVNALLEIIMQRRTYRVANIMPDSEARRSRITRARRGRETASMVAPRKIGKMQAESRQKGAIEISRAIDR